MNHSLLKLSPALFVAALLCFFLPFVTVSCQGQPLLTMTGIEMVTGTQMNQPSMMGKAKQRSVNGSPVIAAVAASALLGLGLALRSMRTGSVAPGVVAALGIAGLIGERLRLGSELAKQGEGMLRLELGAGYLGVGVCLAGAALLHWLMKGVKPPSRWEEQVAEQESAEPERAPTL